MEIMPVKEIELAGGLADGKMVTLPVGRSECSISSKERNSRITYEFSHIKPGTNTEVFREISRTALV